MFLYSDWGGGGAGRGNQETEASKEKADVNFQQFFLLKKIGLLSNNQYSLCISQDSISAVP